MADLPAPHFALTRLGDVPGETGYYVKFLDANGTLAIVKTSSWAEVDALRIYAEPGSGRDSADLHLCNSRVAELHRVLGEFLAEHGPDCACVDAGHGDNDRHYGARHLRHFPNDKAEL